MILNLKNIIIAFLIGTVCGAWPAYHFTEKIVNADWQTAEDKKIATAQQLAADAQKKADAQEKASNDLKTQMDAQHDKDQQTIADTLASNQQLAIKLGGLRDPGQRSGCSNTSGVRSSAKSPSDSNGGSTCDSRLSVQASQFLLEFAAQADRVADYSTICRSYAKEVDTFNHSH